MNTDSEKSKVICPRCHGDKTTDMGWEFLGHSRGHHKITEECSLCEGEGITIREINYKPLSTCDQKPISDTSRQRELQEKSINSIQTMNLYQLTMLDRMIEMFVLKQ